VLNPSKTRTKVLCSHYCDFGSLLDGCNSSASDGFEGRGVPYPAEHLKEMLERSMFDEGQKKAYNEVRILPRTRARTPLLTLTLTPTPTRYSST
jgi:hypothetical protein